MAKKIWIVLQQKDGKLHRMSREAIVAGQKLATATGASVEAVVLGAGIAEAASEASSYQLAAVWKGDHEALGTYTPGAYISALAAAVGSAKPDFVLFPHTYQSVDYFPRLAHELGAGLLPEVTEMDASTGELLFKRPILGGKVNATVRVKGEGMLLLSVQSGAFSVDDAVAGSCEVMELDLAGNPLIADRVLLGVEEVRGDQVDLSKAEIVVAVGRGVGGADKMAAVEELAELLGAEIGASRPVIDNGWLPRDRQIGSSGQTVAPKLYLAVGISGAIQHLVGMKASSVVVAINKDPGAPIFAVADYGVVGDLHEILPALNEAIREARA